MQVVILPSHLWLSSQCFPHSYVSMEFSANRRKNYDYHHLLNFLSSILKSKLYFLNNTAIIFNLHLVIDVEMAFLKNILKVYILGIPKKKVFFT